MVKGIRILIALAVLGILFLPQPTMASGWNVGTIAAEWYGDNHSVFWTVLRASITIDGVTVTDWGFVWDTTSHGDPGSTAPGDSDYTANWQTGGSETTSFNFGFGPEQDSGAFIEPYEVYYYRACAKAGGVWDYGDELIVTGQSSLWLEGSWAPYGSVDAYYMLVTTNETETVDYDAGVVMLYGQVDWTVIYTSFPGYEYGIDDYGFVVDTSSHDNPSGWYSGYSDVHPGASDYADYYEADDMESQDGDFAFSFQLVDLDPEETYYVRAVADLNIGGDWVYGPEVEFELELPCELPELEPPYDFVAIPVMGSEALLSWWSDNPDSYTNACGTYDMWPNLMAIVRMREWEYPDHPFTTTDGSVQVYYAPEQQGETQYTVHGLTPGVSYYFRVEFFDPDTDNETQYDEDFCTPYSSIIPPEEVDIPENWFLDPTCDSWENVPMAMTIVNGIYDKLEIPTTTLCLWINLLLLSVAMTTSYGGAWAWSRAPGSTSTILVPFIVMCFGFIVGPFIGAFPGFFLAIGAIIGLGVAFAWARA